MGIFDFIFGKKSESKVINENVSERRIKENISTLTKIADIFENSALLRSTGMGRTEKMVMTTQSYIVILGFLYENKFKYGSMNSVIPSSITNRSHFVLYQMAFADSNKLKTVISEVSTNWKQVLTTLNLMKMDPQDGPKIIGIQHQINDITSTFNYISSNL